MEEITSREKVLKKIRGALLAKNENPYPSLDTESSVYHDFTDTIDITFAREFSQAAGKFIYCESESDLRNNLSSLMTEKQWDEIYCLDPEIISLLKDTGIKVQSGPEAFNSMRPGITQCEYLIARFGSIMVSSKQAGGRKMNVFPESHIVIARTNQIVPEIKDAISGIQKKYEGNLPSMISLITGPSRTADIEKTLVMGAHGPRELYLFLLDNDSHT
jgi:L-lactate dehydrogenase complex protein LldG